MDDSYQELRAKVEADGGLRVVTMRDLRNVEGVSRIGSQVPGKISQQLGSHGMGHIPAELPSDQNSPVRLYVLGTPIADAVDAILEPSPNGDAILRGVGDSEAREDRLRQIREIVRV
ncbi:hypothetical protein [Streptomyces adonidis]|uniref:hypothetical protein n=1 Tax=Streptomyces adonidis TaxID=3231367 RepID=UPI0034DAC406